VIVLITKLPSNTNPTSIPKGTSISINVEGNIIEGCVVITTFDMLDPTIPSGTPVTGHFVGEVT